MATEVNVVLAAVPENPMDEKTIDLSITNGGAGLADEEFRETTKLERGDHIGIDERSENDSEEEETEEDDSGANNEEFVSNLSELRKRRSKTPLLPSTVTVIPHYCNQHEHHGENESGENGTILGHVYLVGTAHFSLDSQDDVRKTIQETQPDIVMMELCPSRIAVLALNEETLLEEARNLTTEKVLKIVRETGFVQGVMHILLLSMSAHIARQLGMAPGGEFRVAFQEAEKVPGCRWHLGDRQIQTTMARALGTLSLWQKIKLFWSIMWSHNIKITKEEVERCKQRDLLEELLREMAGEFPELSRIFVHERDLYMAHTLYALLHHAAARRREQLGPNEPWEPAVVVGVVGMGHVPGIVANFGKNIDVQELMRSPAPSRSTRYAKVVFKTTFVGVSAYVTYRCALYAYRLFIR